MVIGDGGVCEAVERGKAIYVVPYLLIVGMENVCAVLVNVDALNVFGVYVARNVRSLVYYENLFPASVAWRANTEPYRPDPTTRWSYCAM